MSARDLENSIEIIVFDNLKEMGFKAIRKHRIAIETTDGFLGWVGLNRGKSGDYLRINPFVGIHSIPVMRLCSQLAGESYKLAETATYADHLGELAPHIDQFLFESGTNVQPEALRLATAIHEFGLPFMRQLSSYEALLKVLEPLIYRFGGYPERYAATLYCSGQSGNAKKFVESFSEHLKNQHPLLQANFQTFHTAFLKLPDSTP